MGVILHTVNELNRCSIAILESEVKHKMVVSIFLFILKRRNWTISKENKTIVKFLFTLAKKDIAYSPVTIFAYSAATYASTKRAF
jgi:hypothetical protein